MKTGCTVCTKVLRAYLDLTLVVFETNTGQEKTHRPSFVRFEFQERSNDLTKWRAAYGVILENSEQIFKNGRTKGI